MKQVLFRIPGLGLTVYSFGALVVVAFSAGLFLAAWRSHREKLDPDVVYGLASWMLVGGLVGARLVFVVEYWGEKVLTLGEALRVWEGGLVFYGSMIGGLLAFFGYRFFRSFPILATLDALAPSVPLGLAIGRVGCFLNGCCYGDFCDIPGLAVRFPKGSPPWLAERAQGWISRDAVGSLPIHPAQLYAALNGLILFVLLSAYYPIRRRDGSVIALLMLTYPITRFLIDLLRNDEGAFLLGLTMSQAISVALVPFALLFRVYLAARPPDRWADQPTTPKADLPSR